MARLELKFLNFFFRFHNQSRLGMPSPKKSAVFLNIVQKAFDPPSPFYLNICPILQGVFFERVFERWLPLFVRVFFNIFFIGFVSLTFVMRSKCSPFYLRPEPLGATLLHLPAFFSSFPTVLSLPRPRAFH